MWPKLQYMIANTNGQWVWADETHLNIAASIQHLYAKIKQEVPVDASFRFGFRPFTWATLNIRRVADRQFRKAMIK